MMDRDISVEMEAAQDDQGKKSTEEEGTLWAMKGGSGGVLEPVTMRSKRQN